MERVTKISGPYIIFFPWKLLNNKRKEPYFIKSTEAIFLFLVQIRNIFQIWSGFEIISKTSPFGPATMHDEANKLYPAMHDGGVKLPRGM